MSAASPTVAERLLTTLRNRGVTFSAQGSTLRYTAPTGALDSDLLATLREHKAELLALLSCKTSTTSQTPETSQPTPTAQTPVEALTAQNAEAYLASIALTVEMTDCCQDLANVSPPLDRAAWEAAHARYCRKADQVKAWYRATLPLDPAMAEDFNESLKTRMYRIRDEWRGRQKGAVV